MEIEADVPVVSHASLAPVCNGPSIQKFKEKSIAKPISIGDNRWNYADVVLLHENKLGTSRIVAAGSDVIRKMPRDVIVDGVLERVIRKSQAGRKCLRYHIALV